MCLMAGEDSMGQRAVFAVKQRNKESTLYPGLVNAKYNWYM